MHDGQRKVRNYLGRERKKMTINQNATTLAPRSLRRSRRSRQGLTLIELMLVLVILVILASTATVFYSKAQDNALIQTTRGQIAQLKSGVDLYKISNRTLPPDLQSLITQPSGATRWNGPYLDANQLPKDSWDNDYQYSSQGSDFTIWSIGPDQTNGSNDDISSKDQ